MPVTKSQRKKATVQHHGANPPRRKWYHVTCTTLNTDGSTTSVSKTASTGNVLIAKSYTRRGREL